MKKEKKEQNNKKSHTLIIYFILIISILFLYSRYIEPFHLIVNEYKIESKNVPKSFDGIKIVHFSDVHYGTTVDNKYLNKIVDLINKQKPDIVVFTGDFFDKRKNISEKEISNINNTLSKINSNLGNYAVNGNHDIKYLKKFEEVMNNNFTVLNNEEKLIYYKDSIPISIAGFTDARETETNYEILNNNSNYRIVLIHEPDEYSKIKDYNFNVIMSGHSHGGQVRIPLIGKVYTPDGSKKYYDNYYKFNDKEMFISYGIGTSLFDIRFNCTPSINLYRLYAQN